MHNFIKPTQLLYNNNNKTIRKIIVKLMNIIQNNDNNNNNNNSNKIHAMPHADKSTNIIFKIKLTAIVIHHSHRSNYFQI